MSMLFFSKSYPVLFPDGRGDPTRMGRLVNVNLTEAVDHLLKFGYFDDEGKAVFPFSENKSWIFFSLNQIERSRVVSTTRVMFARSSDFHSLTSADLRDILSNSERTRVFIDRLRIWASSIRGNHEYWRSVSSDLQNLLEHLDSPKYFLLLVSVIFITPKLLINCFLI